MKYCKALLLIVVGAALGLLGNKVIQPRPVRAQASACVAQVPASWGDFKGASSFGLAFQDGQGNLRFLQHLPCGSYGSSTQSAEPQADLLLERK